MPVLLICLSSCSDPQSIAVSDAQPLVRQLTQAIGQHNQRFAEPELPIWPNGFFMHPQTQAESFELQAILTPVDTVLRSDTSTTVGFVAQMDRLGLRPETEQDVEHSGWQYDGVVRSSVFVDSAISTDEHESEKNADYAGPDPLAKLATLQRDQWVQRMALGLGGVTRQMLWIGNDQLVITPIDTSAKCQREYRWTSTLSATDSMELHMSINMCPQSQALGALVTWQQASQSVSASLLTSDGQGNERSLALSGFAWLRHSWGNLPKSGGAVLIDSLQIRLDGQQWLDISRTRRRSGRGPQTVLATLHSEKMPATPITLEWEDSEERAFASSGSAYPRRINLRSGDNGVDVLLTVMNRLSESTDAFGTRLHVPVTVSGSHEGAGFLVFNALPVVP